MRTTTSSTTIRGRSQEQDHVASGARLTQAVASLERAERALAGARVETHADRRYVSAHVAALRATAAVLSVRARPQSLRRQSNAWVLLERVAPELAEWAAFFAAGATKRAAAEAGHVRAVTDRDADDLVRDVEQFLRVVERLVGLPERLDLSTEAS
jgi:hypothetical protein